ncbi:expressed unknown protein [Seminavis robusta]|uniref:Uncharacterized protein n=1 Tax=Seminavis robusta TaxID=568900 RepID=A0A9N8EVC3_9STRA|nr:expressed unknown protein [Seminavis robusta]|eukprot:Sro1720_g293490.1 n/a (963) ;mRNA; r:18161-21049
MSLSQRSRSLAGVKSATLLEGLRNGDDAALTKAAPANNKQRESSKKDGSKSLVGLRMMELIDNTVHDDNGTSRRRGLAKTDSVKKLEGMGLVKSRKNGSKRSVKSGDDPKMEEAPSYNWANSTKEKRSKSLVDLRMMDLVDDKTDSNKKESSRGRGLVKKKSARKLEGTGIVKSRRNTLDCRSKSPKKPTSKPNSRVKELSESFGPDRATTNSKNTKGRKVSQNLQGLLEKFSDHSSNSRPSRRSNRSASRLQRVGSVSSLRKEALGPGKLSKFRTDSNHSLGSLYGSCRSGLGDSDDSDNDDNTFYSAAGDCIDDDLSSLGDMSSVNNYSSDGDINADSDSNAPALEEDDQSVATCSTAQDGSRSKKKYRVMLRSSILAVVGAQRISSCQESIDALEGTEQSFLECQQKVADAKKQEAARCIQRFFKYCKAVHENHKDEILYWQEEKNDVLRRKEEELETVKNMLHIEKQHALEEFMANLEASGKSSSPPVPDVNKLDWDTFCIQIQELKDEVKEERQISQNLKENIHQLMQANKLLKASEDTQITKLQGFTERILNLKTEMNELEAMVNLGERAMKRAVPEVDNAGKVLEEVQAKKNAVVTCLVKIVDIVKNSGDSDLFGEIKEMQLRLEVELTKKGGARRIIGGSSRKPKNRKNREMDTLKVLEKVVSQRDLKILEKVVSQRDSMNDQSSSSNSSDDEPSKRQSDSTPLMSLIQMSQEPSTGRDSTSKKNKRKDGMKRTDSAPLLSLIEIAHQTPKYGKRTMERCDSAPLLAEMRRKSGSSNTLPSSMKRVSSSSSMKRVSSSGSRLNRANSSTSSRAKSDGMKEILRRSAPSLVINIADDGDSSASSRPAKTSGGLRRNGSAPSLALEVGQEAKRERRLKKMSAGLKRSGSNRSLSHGSADDDEDDKEQSRSSRRRSRSKSRNGSKSSKEGAGAGLMRNTSAPPSISKYRKKLDKQDD